jgi:phosphoribosylaminoimidazole-succinocarboxamide synthase
MVDDNVDEIIKNQIDKTLDATEFHELGQLYRGKVRDNYIKQDIRIIIATDRLSAFDRVITTIPFKGQMLNQTSAFWFEKTKNLVKNHLIEIPDPNVSVVHQCELIPVEMIVRAYITGTAWRYYERGDPISGIQLPKGLQKNQRLDEVLLTPSTKAESGHDQYLPKKEIIQKGLVSAEIYEKMEESAMKLFKFGSQYSLHQGLIMVDTKYEFGLKDGELMVIDEIHTQDSSRFWLSESYDDRFKQEEEPEILDKEIFRAWLMNKYPEIFPDITLDQSIPPISSDIKIELAKRYMRSYEKITGLKFKGEVSNVKQRIRKNLEKAKYL